MAVKVQCSRCNATLELDEGFRGGVCRCGCGALLQVPRSATEGAAKVRPAGPPTAQQPALRPTSESAQSTLSDPRSNTLSGISGSGLPRPVPVAHSPKARSSRSRSGKGAPTSPTAPPAPPPTKTSATSRPKSSPRLPLLIALMIAAVLLVVAAAYLLR